MKMIPYIVDNWSPNTDIASMRTVLSGNALKRYESMFIAYTKSLDSQSWFLTLMYDSGMFPVFALFNIQRDNLLAIRGLLTYNWSPNIPNLIKFMNIVIPTGWSYTIDEAQGEVILNITSTGLGINDVTYNSDSEFEVMDNANSRAVEVLNESFVISPQNTYIFTTHVMCGIKLSINFTTG